VPNLAKHGQREAQASPVGEEANKVSRQGRTAPPKAKWTVNLLNIGMQIADKGLRVAHMARGLGCSAAAN